MQRGVGGASGPAGQHAMKRVRDFYSLFDRVDRVIAAVLALVIVGVLGVLAASVARQSGVDAELQQSLEELQDTTADLQDTVEQLRSSSDDPEVLLSLDEIDEKLETVSGQLGVLGQTIDEPLLAAGDPGRDPDGATTPATHSDLSRILTVVAWVLGGASVVIALVLAVVLRRRWAVKRRRRLLDVHSISRRG